MIYLVTIALTAVIPGLYKSEEPLGSCPKNAPFRMDDGNCLNFTKICIKEENSQCKSVLNACSQCPPSGYTISMLATLNDKVNELSTLPKEIKDMKNTSESTRKQVELLATLLGEMKGEISTLRKAIKDMKNTSESTRKQVEYMKNKSESTRKQVELLTTLNGEMKGEMKGEISTLQKEIKDIKNTSESTRKQVELLTTLNGEMKGEISTLRKEIKDMKDASESTRKQVQLLATLHGEMKELSTLPKEIKDMKNTSESTRKQVEYNKDLIVSIRNDVKMLSSLNWTINEIYKVRGEITESQPYTISQLLFCILSFIGIVYIIYHVLNPRQCQYTKIRSRALEMKRYQARGSGKEKKTFIDTKPSTSLAIQNRHLEDDNTAEFQFDKIIEDLYVQGEATKIIISKLVEINWKMNAQTRNIQNIQNIPDEDMRNISSKLEEIIKKLNVQKMKDEISVGVAEEVLDTVTKERDNQHFNQ